MWARDRAMPGVVIKIRLCRNLPGGVDVFVWYVFQLGAPATDVFPSWILIKVPVRVKVG